jgi:hypothetical protein
MANTFTSALKKDIGSSPVSVYTPPAGKKAILIELDIANTTTSSVTASVYITRSSVDYYIVKNAPITYGSSLQVISGQKVVLNDGDEIFAVSSTATSLDVVASILEDV